MYTDRQKREIFHFLFLERLLHASDPKLYVVKGGVNLRFFYHSPRYSEDMDLDVLGGAVHTLKKNGYKILEEPSFQRSLRAFGIERIILNDPSKAKQTQTVQRFRVRLVSSAGEELPTKIEFSRRSKGSEKYTLDRVDSEIARAYQRGSFLCHHYSGEIAVLQKIEALAERGLPQARDVFDLQVLKERGFLEKANPLKHLKPATLIKAGKNLELLTYDDFVGHVLEFLDEPDKRRYEGVNSWKEMKNFVGKALQRNG